MISAFLYLQLTSLQNRLRERFQRLKQPKYLVGAVVGLAYFYFFFVHRFQSPVRGRGNVAASTSLSPEMLPLLLTAAALGLAVITVLIWLIPNSRAALRFSEAEVAFLFPAPVTRRRLIHFKLLRSQLGILVSVFFFTVIFRRAGTALGGSPWTHAAGWWVLLSTINLHLLGASFAREQLLARGVTATRRQLLVVAVLALLILSGWTWARDHIPAPTAADLADLTTALSYVGQVLAQAPFSWVLAPFTWLLHPYFAAGTTEFFLALGPALLVLAAHYWWVVRADVAFEEASLEQAREHGERQAAIRSGDWRAARAAGQKTTPRPDPFPLAATGPAVTAFLWKNLLALGPFFRFRTALITAGLIIGFHVWAAATRLNPHVYMLTLLLPLAFGAWLLVIGPMLMRSDLRLLVSHFDLLKSYPLRGWQVILGSLLPAIVLIVIGEWLLLLLAGPSALAAPINRQLAGAVLGTGAAGIALVLPPLVGLLLSIPYAATLFFPAWTEVRGPRGGGIEAMGQRLIFFAGYLLVLAVALLPATLCAGLTAFIAHWLGGMVAAIVSAAIVASLIIAAEFAAVVWWLGDRFERLDLSAEMPR